MSVASKRCNNGLLSMGSCCQELIAMKIEWAGQLSPSFDHAHLCALACSPAPPANHKAQLRSRVIVAATNTQQEITDTVWTTGFIGALVAKDEVPPTPKRTQLSAGPHTTTDDHNHTLQPACRGTRTKGLTMRPRHRRLRL
jgi:hypothetical protein